MQVILLEHIRKLGKLGDLVNVKSGFARNFLIPFGKAQAATKANLASFEERRAELEKKANAILQDAKQKAELLHGKEFTIQAMASDEGKLYGSIGGSEIASAINNATQLTINKSDIMLPDGPIHFIDEYHVTLIFDAEITAVIKLVVTKQAAS